MKRLILAAWILAATGNAFAELPGQPTAPSISNPPQLWEYRIYSFSAFSGAGGFAQQEAVPMEHKVSVVQMWTIQSVCQSTVTAERAFYVARDINVGTGTMFAHVGFLVSDCVRVQ